MSVISRRSVQQKDQTITLVRKLPLEMPRTYEDLIRYVSWDPKMSLPPSAFSKGQKKSNLIPMNVTFRLMVQRRRQTASRVIKLPLEMPKTPIKTMSDVCPWLGREVLKTMAPGTCIQSPDAR